MDSHDFSRDEVASILKILSMTFMRPSELNKRILKEAWKVLDPQVVGEIDEGLSTEYTRLFRLGNPVPCPPYESYYLTEDGTLMSEHADELVSIMRGYGLTVKKEFKDLPEHISVILEFMHYLLSLEDDKSLSDVSYVAREHMLKWIPEFCNCLKRESRVKLYIRACDILLEVLKSLAELK